MSWSALRTPVLVILAYVGQLGLFVGLLTTATPIPWAITACVSVLFAALAVIAEIKFTNLIPQTADVPPKLTRTGRWTVGALCVVVAASMLTCSFLIGRHTQPEPGQYPFVTIGPGMVPAKAAPIEVAGYIDVFEPGRSVFVDCKITGEDGHKWYRLSDLKGWLRDDAAMPAPHTGADRLPTCPD